MYGFSVRVLKYYKLNQMTEKVKIKFIQNLRNHWFVIK